MRLGNKPPIIWLAPFGVIACSGSNAALPPAAQGGSVGTSIGGSLGTGGGAVAGGNTNGSANGGASAQGGGISTGGIYGNGGSPNLGGSPSTGGNQGVGGVVATGGKTSGTGGNLVGAGGSVNPTGGGPQGNGGISTAAGGRSATGGGVATGGTTVSSTCVDTPPPNGDTCAHAVLYNWCGAPWMNGTCAVSCNLCGAGGAGGSSAGAGGNQNTGGTRSTGGVNGAGGAPTGGANNVTGGSTGNGTTLPPITGGSSAWASRYWDCCKPACGWTGNASNPIPSCSESNQQLSDMTATNACQSGGTAYMCWSGIPRAVSNSVSYGFAAASGSNYSCGKCFQIQFDGGSNNGTPNAGTTAIKGKQMIIQIINNGGVQANQFDLLIPGGGVGALDACQTQWGTSNLGSQYGGFLSACQQSNPTNPTSCVQSMCNTVFAGKSDLLAGCNWFLNWFEAADNPTFVYQPVNCPSDFTSVMGGL